MHKQEEESWGAVIKIITQLHNIVILLLVSPPIFFLCKQVFSFLIEGFYWRSKIILITLFSNGAILIWVTVALDTHNSVSDYTAKHYDSVWWFSLVLTMHFSYILRNIISQFMSSLWRLLFCKCNYHYIPYCNFRNTVKPIILQSLKSKFILLNVDVKKQTFVIKNFFCYWLHKGSGDAVA